MKYAAKILAIILNTPWTLIGLCTVILSGPKGVVWSTEPPAFIFRVRSFWWYRYFPKKQGVRAITIGHVIQLSRWADESDIKHELIHVEQYMMTPFIHPILYTIESLRYGGGMRNQYEREAYQRSGNRYGYFIEDHRMPQ